MRSTVFALLLLSAPAMAQQCATSESGKVVFKPCFPKPPVVVGMDTIIGPSAVAKECVIRVTEQRVSMVGCSTIRPVGSAAISIP